MWSFNLPVLLRKPGQFSLPFCFALHCAVFRYKAHIGQLFARLWHWGLVRNMWRGPNELHQSVRISFASGGRSVTPPYGPWEHVPPHVWTDQSNSAATQDEAEDEAEVCVLCCQRRSTVAVCDECKEHYCNECIDTHTCGTNVVC